MTDNYVPSSSSRNVSHDGLPYNVNSMHDSYYSLRTPGSGFEEYNRNRLPYIPHHPEIRSKPYPLEPRHIDYGMVDRNYGTTSMYMSHDFRSQVDDRHKVSNEPMNNYMAPFHSINRDYIHTNHPPRIPEDESKSMNMNRNNISIYGPPYVPDIAVSHPWPYPNHPYNHVPGWPIPPISAPSYPTEYTADVRPVDVLSGRGGATNSHSGNAEFRSIVDQYKRQYLKAKKCDKPAVASLIVDIIRKKGGRFLRKHTIPGSSQEPVLDANGNVIWYDIGDDKAKEKTCQALREGAPEIRRRTGDEDKDDDDSDENNEDREDDDHHHQQQQQPPKKKLFNPTKTVNTKISPKVEPTVSSPSNATHDRTHSSGSSSLFVAARNNLRNYRALDDHNSQALTPSKRSLTSNIRPVYDISNLSHISFPNSPSHHNGGPPYHHHVHADSYDDTTIEVDDIMMIRPYQHLIPNGHLVEPIQISDLSHEDRECYLRSFIPPSPRIRRKDKKGIKILSVNEYREF